MSVMKFMSKMIFMSHMIFMRSSHVIFIERADHRGIHLASSCDEGLRSPGVSGLSLPH